MKYQLHIVTPDSPREMRERVFRLRHRVYEQEMQLGSHAAESGQLRDVLDGYSTSLLATVDGEDAATVRYTFARNGPLECEEVSGHWRDMIANLVDDRRTLVEATRLMVIRKHRKTALSMRIAWAAYRRVRKEGGRRVMVAGKVGKLSRLYQQWKAERVSDRDVPYYIGGGYLGEYNLFSWDFGAPGSIAATGFYLRVAQVLVAGLCRESAKSGLAVVRRPRGQQIESKSRSV